jgi:hypothetical protein
MPIMKLSIERQASTAARCPILPLPWASDIQLHSGGSIVDLDEAAAFELQHADHYRHIEQLGIQIGL